MSDGVLRLKVVLADTEPPIWRRIEVPADLTLKELHAVIQAAMGWENAHLYQFQVGRETIAGPGMGGGGFLGPRPASAGQCASMISPHMGSSDSPTSTTWVTAGNTKSRSRRCCRAISSRPIRD
jgi:hypothetical protein